MSNFVLPPFSAGNRMVSKLFKRRQPAGWCLLKHSAQLVISNIRNKRERFIIASRQKASRRHRKDTSQASNFVRGFVIVCTDSLRLFGTVIWADKIRTNSRASLQVQNVNCFENISECTKRHLRACKSHGTCFWRIHFWDKFKLRISKQGISKW